MPIQRPLSSPLASAVNFPLGRLTQFLRWALGFDGVDDRGQLQFRAINPDGDIDVEWYQEFQEANNAANGVIVAQCGTGTNSAQEFRLTYLSAGRTLELIVGGAQTTAFAEAPKRGKYRITLAGSQLTVWLDGSIVRSTTFKRGAAREPSAPLWVGARQPSLNLFPGILRDLRINGVLYPMGDRNQAIQLPSPSGLGAELITQTVLENPAFKGSQWTYLGDGRWQYLGDGLGELVFISNSNLPEAGFIEFEVESYQHVSGTNGLRISHTITNFFGDRLVYGVGKFRAFYTVKPASISFTRNNPGTEINCIIKNISFRPLWVASATELLANGAFNTDTAGWSAINSTVAWSSGTLRVEVAAGVTGGATQNLPMLTAGKYYLLTATVAEVGPSATASVVALRQAAGSFAVLNSASVTAAGTVSFVFMATASDAQISLRSANASAATYCRFDNVSVRELTSLCNPLTLINTVSTGWQEIEA